MRIDTGVGSHDRFRRRGAGAVEPGETPAAAGRREVKEEAGLDIVVGRILGKRIHSQTGRQVIYLAVRRSRRAEARSVFASDQAEVDEVRWLTRADVDDLMPSAYDPVRAYLERDHRRYARIISGLAEGAPKVFADR